MGILWLNQDEYGRVRLSPRAQYDLLEFLSNVATRSIARLISA